MELAWKMRKNRSKEKEEEQQQEDFKPQIQLKLVERVSMDLLIEVIVIVHLVEYRCHLVIDGDSCRKVSLQMQQHRLQQIDDSKSDDETDCDESKEMNHNYQSAAHW